MATSGRFSQLPEPVRPEDTTEVTWVEVGDEQSLADKQAAWRTLLYAVDDA